ncbi:hypothetical protein HPG69_008082 [Diceros bicornis minor]|uniref:Sperm microtubule inner protein 1 C-terminal domain-containing protein n=1 Tax=Diceros bicornis minor TaxID=77932 RepID=A0A7J7F4B3_DICBM|nr:hypothetical protein HPG69_008082 [Diceros bicornis minor]
MRAKGLGPESLRGRTRPPARHPGWVVAGLCSLFRPDLSYCLWGPRSLPPPAAQPLLCLATRPSLAAQASLLAGAHPEGGCRRVAWKMNYGRKYLKEGPTPRKRLQQAPFRSALGAGPVPATSSPDSKEIQGVRDQLSRGVGVQGPPAQGRSLGGPNHNSGASRPDPARGLRYEAGPLSTLQLLFEDVSHDGQGRALYLRERHRQKPEEKFPCPILSSWEDGWHVGGAMKDTRAPTYARSQPITKTFYMNSSVFHFPRRTDQLT